MAVVVAVAKVVAEMVEAQVGSWRWTGRWW